MIDWSTFRKIIAGLVVIAVAISAGLAGDQLTGIAAVIGKEGETLRIIDVLPDGPAELAGLMKADEILAIDGEPVGEQSLEELAAMLRGDAFSTVELKVRRDGGDLPVTYRVMRKTFAVPKS